MTEFTKRSHLAWFYALTFRWRLAICGASAALAISSVLPRHAKSEPNTCMTVVAVTSLSTVAMVFYPVIAQLMGFGDTAAGIFLGATIHDVAQVVGAGYMISDTAGETGAIVKLMRVACLVPAVILIGLFFRQHGAARQEAGHTTPLLPLFLIAFVALAALNSMGWVPDAVASDVGEMSRWCLVIAVAALGVKTSLKDFVTAGPGPVAALVLQTLALALFALIGIAWVLPAV